MAIHIERRTGQYNERRYGRPYIAVVDFAANHQGACKWGEWIGSPGDEGLLMIDAEPGDIVMIGQKDYRNSRHSEPTYYQLGADGNLEELSGKAAAFRAFRAAHSPAPTPSPAE